MGNAPQHCCWSENERCLNFIENEKEAINIGLYTSGSTREEQIKWGEPRVEEFLSLSFTLLSVRG